MDKDYLGKIKERVQKARVYKKFQATGLLIAELLGDPGHKSLYIKLAKEYDDRELIFLAKIIAENKKIAKKGAYFMSMLKTLRKRV